MIVIDSENVMEGNVLKIEGHIDEEGMLDCSFSSGNTPDIVFILLGHNDQLSDEKTSERFVTSYVNFVSRILDNYGADTQICMMTTLSHGIWSGQINDEHTTRCAIMQEAAVAVATKFPENVNFIDCEDIISWGVEVSSDKTHPTAAGHNTLTEKVSEYLADVYG